jgi:hypothetical protein
MRVTILNESGYEEAIKGLSLSKGASHEAATKAAVKLAPMDGGHNKVLESIYVWLDIQAPRYWWQEADTYRLSTKQSGSTMHTIQKRLLTQDDFDRPVWPPSLKHLNKLLQTYQKSSSINLTSDEALDDLVDLKNELPEGFLQERVWVMNYKCLRNILLQRTTHRLLHWKFLCKVIRENIQHPELLP